jgi:hypothetical protein
MQANAKHGLKGGYGIAYRGAINCNNTSFIAEISEKKYLLCNLK